MLPHPETHLEIARQRHQAAIARAARYPLASSSPSFSARWAALAGSALRLNAPFLRSGRDRPYEAHAQTCES